jgi:hypothetical protein
MLIHAENYTSFQHGCKSRDSPECVTDLKLVKQRRSGTKACPKTKGTQGNQVALKSRHGIQACC